MSKNFEKKVNDFIEKLINFDKSIFKRNIFLAKDTFHAGGKIVFPIMRGDNIRDLGAHTSHLLLKAFIITLAEKFRL